MTTPTPLSRETINGDTFTSHRARKVLFHTPRMARGVRITFRINGVTIPRAKWEQARTTALIHANAEREG